MIENETVRILTGTAVADPYSGESTRIDWTNPAEFVQPRCSVQPVQGNELTFNRDTVITRWQLWGPADMPVTAYDRIQHRGDVYEVDGDIMRWSAPLAHVTFLMKKAT